MFVRAVSVVGFVVQHHRNAAQLAPVVRADTAGFHGHRREEGGRGALPAALPHLTQRLRNSLLIRQMALSWNHKEIHMAAARAD